MLKSSLLEILRTFSKQELIKFEDFVRSPYFNKKENFVKLFLEIKKYSPELSDEDLTIRKSSSDTEKVIVYRLPEVKKNRLKKFIIWQWLLKNIKIIQEADIVHCHDVFYWYLPFRFLYFRKPVFTTFHGYEKYPVPFKNIVIRKISEKLSWGNICVGMFIEKWYGTKATFISYGGVDSKIKNPKSIRQLRLNRSQLRTKYKKI